MVIGKLCSHPAPGCLFDESELQQIWFIYILNGIRFLAYTGCKRFQTHRTSAELLDDACEHVPVSTVQTNGIYLEGIECHCSSPGIYDAVTLDLRKVTDPLEKPVGYPGRPPRSFCYLLSSPVIDLYAQYSCRTLDDEGEFVIIVHFQAVYDAKPVPQRRCQQPCPC